MACCSEKLSGACSMRVYLSDCRTAKNPPDEWAREEFPP
jgi:hypothetical protein